MGCTNSKGTDVIVEDFYRKEDIDNDVISKKLFELKPITLKIKCDNHETITNILIIKNKEIKFKIEGKWKPDPTLPECDSKGFDNYLINKYNYGSLVGKLDTSEDIFLLENNGSFLSKDKSGILVLRMNNNQRTELYSSGYLSLTIYGGINTDNNQNITLKDIDTISGWDTNKIYSNLFDFKNERYEEELYILINKIRCFPKKFINNYIILDTFDIQNKIFSNGKNLLPLKQNDKLNDAINYYINSYFYKNNNGDDSLKKCLKDEGINSPYFLSIQLDEKYRPNQILLKYLICNTTINDKIFSENMKIFSLKLIPYNKAYYFIFIISE